MNERELTFNPPPPDPSKAPIENGLELRPVDNAGPDIFTNVRPLWHPPGARGIYGGGAIAQSLCAAQLTVPKDFTVHSMHFYFLNAGDAESPIIFYVERLRDGNSFASRTVQARQRDRPISTTTISFLKSNGVSRNLKNLEHSSPMPDIPLPQKEWEWGESRPFESHKAGILNHSSTQPETKRIRQWIRARGKISSAGGVAAHLSALAYMSDSYFIGTVSRVHNVRRFSSPAALQRMLNGVDPAAPDSKIMRQYLTSLAEEEDAELQAYAKDNAPRTADIAQQPGKELGMIASLDHSIFFHNFTAFRADDWMLMEMATPWAGHGRGLVIQKIWSHDGTLIATCTQEGVVRLKQEEHPAPSKKTKL